MNVKPLVGRFVAAIAQRRIEKWKSNPLETQRKVFAELLSRAKPTAFGVDHGFARINTYDDFKKSVPIRDYEELRSYIERAKNGEENVLWPGRPTYFCKTSGTTSGTKYIPITSESMPGHINSARNALLCFTAQTGSADYLNGKMIQLQGSPKLDDINGIPTGRLSGIVANHVPAYLLQNRMPSYQTNCIEDWEEKINAIVSETIHANMTLIAGIPIWIQGYFQKLQKQSGGKMIKDIFPNLELIVHGGVNFKPYKSTLDALVGKELPSIELYPASEGFIAYQDSQQEEGLLLVLNQGMFYEFVPVDEFFEDDPKRVDLSGVELGVNYVLILNTNAGLWGYNLGDTVKFVSLSPYRIVVTGRLKHFISAFGEHVIGEEVDFAMQNAIQELNCEVAEFTVAPQLADPRGGLPFHEWFIEFKKQPNSIQEFAAYLDHALQQKNSYYKDLRSGNILQALYISVVRTDGFNNYMKSIGKFGGQNKVPRLSNDRKIADQLQAYIN